MRSFMMGLLILIYSLYTFAAKEHCSIDVKGYRVVGNSVFPFTIDKQKTCFFAYYMHNPDPFVRPNGSGNPGDTLWYGYYFVNSQDKIYEFPKPLDDDWSSICSIEAISFYDMNMDKIPDVTIIGSCNKQNAVHYTFPIVFIRKNDRYVLDQDVYSNLFGFISLSVVDVRNYIRNPDKYYNILSKRYNLN